VPKSDWPKRLDAFNGRRVLMSDLLRWLDDTAGQYCAIRLSLAIDNPQATNADVTALGLHEYQLHEAAARVMGFKLVPVNDPLPEGAEVPSVTFAPTATGSENTST
jgi:hypothetical protein